VEDLWCKRSGAEECTKLFYVILLDNRKSNKYDEYLCPSIAENNCNSKYNRLIINTTIYFPNKISYTFRLKCSHHQADYKNMKLSHLHGFVILKLKYNKFNDFLGRTEYITFWVTLYTQGGRVT
jgi:hypothetical protein